MAIPYAINTGPLLSSHCVSDAFVVQTRDHSRWDFSDHADNDFPVYKARAVGLSILLAFPELQCALVCAFGIKID